MATVASNAGQLWPTKPTVSATGIVSNISQSNSQASTSFTCIAFSARATALCAAGGSNVFAFYIKDNRYARLDRAQTECTALCANPARNDELAAGLADGSIKLLNMQTGLQHANLRGHKSAIRHLAYTAPGDKLLSVDSETTVIWDAQVQPLSLAGLAGSHGHCLSLPWLHIDLTYLLVCHAAF